MSIPRSNVRTVGLIAVALLVAAVILLGAFYDSIANNDHIFLRMTFTGDRVVVEARDVSAGTMPGEAATFTGRLVRP